MALTSRLSFALAFLAALTASNGYAYLLGRADGREGAEARQRLATAALQRRFDAASAEVNRQSAEIEAYREAGRMLSTEIEDEVRADPRASERVPSDDSLRRLARRWREDGAAP